MRKYLHLHIITDRELKKGSGEIIPAGTMVSYHLQYPSHTEAMAHVVFANRHIGKIITISTKDIPSFFVLPAVGPQTRPMDWIKSGWNASVRNFRRIKNKLYEYNLRLLPDTDQRKEAIKYWEKRK